MWSLLLLPVAWGLFQGGRGLIGGLVGLAALTGLVTAGAARAEAAATDREPEES